MPKHIFIIAGEASGDEHAAKLVLELKQEQTDQYTFSGIGGQNMVDAGVNLLYPLAQYGVTGFSEVIKQFSRIRKVFNLAKQYIQNNQIDLLILIDYPGFNLRFAKVAKSLNLKVLYYISPQIWAWKSKRIYTIKRYVDVMAVILPFEKALYEKEKIPCYFVGNPLTETTKLHHTQISLKHKYQLDKDKHIIAVLPGSRNNEVTSLLPIMLDAAALLTKKHPNKLQFIIPVATTIDRNLIQAMTQSYASLSIKLIFENKASIEIMACANSIMVASGTASLQAALLHKPMVIVYKTSVITYAIASQVIKCAYIGLINLLANRMIVPELIQYDLTPQNLATELDKFISNKQYHHKIEQDLINTCKMLEIKSVDCKLAHLVSSLVHNKLSDDKRSFKK